MIKLLSKEYSLINLRFLNQTNFLKKQNITFFSGVPDSLLKDFCAYVDDQFPPNNHIIAANEGAAVGLAIGHHLSSGKIPLVYLQNSGLGNTVNPLMSLASEDVYSIPILLVIGWRGEPGIKDEPQHKHQGRITPALLDVMDIPYVIIDSSMDQNEVLNLIGTFLSTITAIFFDFGHNNFIFLGKRLIEFLPIIIA